jgi:hypothetical protein
VTAYEVYQQVSGGVVVATLLYALVEVIQEKTRWL